MDGLNREFKYINPMQITRAPWRWKKENPAASHKIGKSLERLGQLKNIVVRQIPGGYEVIDGAEILTTAKTLGWDKILCCDLGPISDEEAKIICMSVDLNRGDLDILALSRELRKMESSDTTLASTTPYSELDIKEIKMLLDFDWGQFVAPEEHTPGLFDTIQQETL